MGTVYQGQPPFEAREAGRQACPERGRWVEGLFESVLALSFVEGLSEAFKA
jgi:hypothetical protein